MAKDSFDNQLEGQLAINDIFPMSDRLFAVSRIFARARKEMSLAEQKTFVFALSQLKFSEEAQSNYVKMDKKLLARVLGVESDPDHLSENLFRMIQDLPKHSYIKVSARDAGFATSGFIITNVTRFKNVFRIKFEEDYIGLFTGLTSDYITMWSSDIFQMTSRRSVQFYEYLRENTDSREKMNSIGLGIRALKEMFDIPKEGKGSYMRSSENGGFDRSKFEKYVIEPLCEDLRNCKMIKLVVQPDGKYYEKVKHGNRVDGYRFYWTYTSHPAVAPADEVFRIQERVDKNPEVLKVARDILKGEKNGKSKTRQTVNRFNDFEQHQYDFEQLEKELWENG